MMFDKTADKMRRNAKGYHFELIKGSTFFFTLFLVVAWEGFRDFVLSFEWYWYLLIAIILAYPVLKIMFSKEESAPEEQKD